MLQNHQNIGLEQVARQRVAKYAEGTYDHEQQLLLNADGNPSTTSNKDEDSESSTTFWDGEAR